MPEPPPRKRFQIHLSTAIVMMFVAGGLIFAQDNAYSSSDFLFPGFFVIRSEGYHRGRLENYYGWPLEAAKAKMAGFDKYDWTIDPISLALDAIAAILILYITWRFCEWLIRRRAARKGG